MDGTSVQGAESQASIGIGEQTGAEQSRAETLAGLSFSNGRAALAARRSAVTFAADVVWTGEMGILIPFLSMAVSGESNRRRTAQQQDQTQPGLLLPHVFVLNAPPISDLR
jgi:hypothetical protein